MQARTRSGEHKKLLEEARKRPGVAEVMKVYQAAAARVTQPVSTRPTIRYSTGGNR